MMKSQRGEKIPVSGSRPAREVQGTETRGRGSQLKSFLGRNFAHSLRAGYNHSVNALKDLRQEDCQLESEH